MTRSHFLQRIAAMGMLLFLATAPAHAQTAATAVQTGGKENRIRPSAGVRPTQRLNNRIQSRVQSRLQNRLGRSYVPQADAASTIGTAKDRATRNGPPQTGSTKSD